MRQKGFLGSVRTITAFALSASDCFYTVLEQHNISLFPDRFPAKIPLVRERMQTFANFAVYFSVQRSHWPILGKCGHF